MKYISYIITLLFLLNTSCKNGEEKTSSPVISVSILPQKYLVDKITSGKYKINVLIPSGASPASYEPSPLQITQLNNSSLYLRIGEIVFEKTWIEKIGKQNPDLNIINISDNIDFIGAQNHRHSNDEEEQEESHQHNIDHGKDPHIWMSAKNMKIISENVLTALTESFPSDSLMFVRNYKILLDEINIIDSLFSSSTEILSGLNFLIYHPALAYLARDYKMTQHVLEFEGKEPGPAHIASIIDMAQELNIKYIFVQRQFSIDNAKSLAKEINAEIIVIDPLGEDWDEQLLNIHSILISK
ncbi:MAG: zinc ABC transporter substrate-binding protein [Bacteroidales bacterium]|nr:zinc ABC transporter substrate-binding protein [Bacteroidales bacterium]